uniref:Uncharacterized protein n=1 Tax=Arundo donax TaxID=35708 RepID=A0A0A9DLQ6_ARUDO
MKSDTTGTRIKRRTQLCGILFCLPACEQKRLILMLYVSLLLPSFVPLSLCYLFSY